MKNKFLLIAILILTALAAFLIRLNFIKYQQDISVVTQPTLEALEIKTVDITKQSLEKNENLRKATLLIQENKLAEARVILGEVLKTENDKNIRSIADITLADTYFIDNQVDLAAESMARIGAETSYPSSTRAFALTTIMQQYYGTKNTNLLKVFGDLENKNLAYIIESAHRQIVALHPMGLSVAYLAGADMKRFADNSKTIYDEAIIKIDNDIVFQDKGQGSNFIVPNTIIAKANLMVKGEKLGYTTQNEVIKTYKEAITSAKVKLQTITAQFAILNYMNYLGKHQVGNEEYINEALVTLEKETLAPMVVSYLARPAIYKDMSGIMAISKVNKNYENFFLKYVPAPKE
jgi:hypothetical protein